MGGGYLSLKELMEFITFLERISIIGLVPAIFISIVMMVLICCYVLPFIGKALFQFIDFACQSYLLIVDTRVEGNKKLRSIKSRKK